MSIQDGAVESLVALGLTEDEARVYCTLLEESPLSGYAIAQRTNIVRAHIYEVLESLYRKGCVTVTYGKIAEYAAIPHRQMLENYARNSCGNRSEAVRQVLAYQQNCQQHDVIWNIHQKQDVYNMLSQMIVESSDYILMKIWAKDLKEIETAVAAAAASGVELHLVVLGAYETESFPFFCYPDLQEARDGTPYRAISAAFGNREVLCGNLSDSEECFCARTKNYCLRIPVYGDLLFDLDLSERYVRDGEHLTKRFGGDLMALRKKYM
ncbi:MAG: TrmB family transcriptional regulator [Oscillospiraceae bacterium]